MSQACVSAQADVQDMQVTRYDLEFAGNPAAAAGIEPTVTQTFTCEHERINLPNSVDSQIHATQVTLTARQGSPDLSFIKSLELTVADQNQSSTQPGSSTQSGSSTDEELLLSYHRTTPQPNERVLVIPVVSGANMAGYWQERVSLFKVTVTGELPATPWAVDVTVDYTGTFHYSS